MPETQMLKGLDGLDAFVERLLQDWKVPACAVAVVKDGTMILSKGYGLRDTNRQLPATADTLFAIGSCTKAFTCAALGMLVDDGKLEWDKPVREYMPAFRLHDPVASERVTARDLVTHRSGLPRHDLLWYGTSYTRHELFERLRYLEPSRDFRAVWQYQNLMYMAAGVLIEQITGQTWEAFVAQRILEPLGMRRSNFSVTVMQQAADFARPYHEKDGQVVEVPYHNLDAIGPAGSINSSVNEMVAWLLLHLNKGCHNDQQLIAEPTLRELHQPHMVMPPGDPADTEMGYASYGLGWVINTYRGRLFSQHGGGIDGFASLVTLMPRDNIGIVVLSNQDNQPLPSILTNRIIDQLLGLEPVEWNQRLLERMSKGKQAEKEAEERARTERKEGKPMTHALQDYAGTYEHPGYGPATVRVEGDHLALSYGVLSSDLVQVHYDTFEARLSPFDPPQQIMFQLDLEGNISAMVAPVQPGLNPVVFKRAPEQRVLAKEVLEKLAGEYELMGMTATVALRGEHALTLIIPGQPHYELTLDERTRFKLKGVEGFSVAFNMDGDRVIEMTVRQPDGVYTATRK